MAASTSSRVCSSSMFLMKWNGIMESFLIDEVEKLPYLWNPRHPHFTKRMKKKIGFQQIAMRMSERWPALEAFFTPVQYFVRGGSVGHRSRASSKHLSPHLPVDELDSSGVKQGLRCTCRCTCGCRVHKESRLDVDVFEK
ncbi:hypothetical protein TNCV_2042221 [Trichonephila clavipes]|nr:hypothetical protein TNCV_2042221 [Trichonephila clavipes]